MCLQYQCCHALCLRGNRIDWLAVRHFTNKNRDPWDVPKKARYILVGNIENEFYRVSALAFHDDEAKFSEGVQCLLERILTRILR